MQQQTHTKPSFPHLSVEMMPDFIEQAPAGAVAMYHVGNLAAARQSSMRANLAARTAMQAQVQLRAFLFQRRRVDGMYEYLIVKRRASCAAPA